MKYTEEICQEQQELVYFYQRFDVQYDMFRPIGPYSDIRNTLEDIITIKFYKGK